MAITLTDGIRPKEMETVNYKDYDFVPDYVTVLEQILWKRTNKEYVIGKCGSAYYVFCVAQNWKGEDTRRCNMVACFRIHKMQPLSYIVTLDYVRTNRTYRSERFLKNWLWIISEFADEVISHGWM